MIIESIFYIIENLFNLIFGWIPDLPSIPDSIRVVVTNFFDIIFQGMGLLGVFFNLTLFKLVFVIILTCIVARETYQIIMWVLKKIPILNIQ